MAYLYGEIARAVLCHLRGARPVGRDRPDQPGVALRSLRAAAGDLSGAARLVPRLARGCSAHIPPLGNQGVRLRDIQSLLPGGVATRDYIYAALCVAVPRGPFCP